MPKGTPWKPNFTFCPCLKSGKSRGSSVRWYHLLCGYLCVCVLFIDTLWPCNNSISFSSDRQTDIFVPVCLGWRIICESCKSLCSQVVHGMALGAARWNGTVTYTVFTETLWQVLGWRNLKVCDGDEDWVSAEHHIEAEQGVNRGQGDKEVQECHCMVGSYLWKK